MQCGICQSSLSACFLFNESSSHVLQNQLCMQMCRMQMRGKAECLALYGIVPGPSKPKDMQTFLGELALDLDELWDPGFRVYDADKDEYFVVKGTIVCTVHDNRGSRDVLCHCDAGNACNI